MARPSAAAPARGAPRSDDAPDPPAAAPAPAPDFAPADYPWVGPAVQSSLLLREGIVDLDPVRGVTSPAEQLDEALVDRDAIEQALAAEGAAPLDERTLVLAVGSNQTPQAIARKYRRAGSAVPVATPFVRCTVHHLAVGHVANSAVPGYVPAAPYRAEGERMELVATWFDDAQLAVIDETEPNYHRVPLHAEDFPLALATGEEPAHIDVYASHRGLVGRERPIPLHHRQQELFDELVGLTGARLLHGDAAEICAALAARPEALRDLLTAHDLIVEDGIPRGGAFRTR